MERFDHEGVTQILSLGGLHVKQRNLVEKSLLDATSVPVLLMIVAGC